MSDQASYRIRHRTHYKYSESVAICQNQLRMMPRAMKSKMSSVQCHRADVTIHPAPNIIDQHRDYFGNQVHTFSIDVMHRELEVLMESELSVAYQRVSGDSDRQAWEALVAAITDETDPNWFEAQEYRFDSPNIRRGDRFANYARQTFAPGRDVFRAVEDLTIRIHDEFEYNTQITDVNTRVEDAFQLRAGVCQDFAQVQIACLRSIGLPARYVSGYLRTTPPKGKPRLVGADESHAWVSVYLGDQLGWVDFDPTNACLCNANHIPIAYARDYSELSPMRGVVLGGGKAILSVSVDVALID